jgi:microcystin-dependent protein
MGQQFLGEIRIFSFNFPPQGWALCNGQTMQINQNQALFALLGTTFGGNGQTTYALPNYQSRIPVHFGQGPGLSNYSMGQVGGEEGVTLNIQQMPSHVHTAQGFAGSGGLGPTTNDTWANVASNPYKGTTDNSMNPATIATNTGGQPHANIAPYLTLNFCIALTGIFPSRNKLLG